MILTGSVSLSLTLAAVMASSAIRSVPKVPLVILLAARFGMSDADKSLPAVTMPCELYVILHFVAPVMLDLSALPLMSWWLCNAVSALSRLF